MDDLVPSPFFANSVLVCLGAQWSTYKVPTVCPAWVPLLPSHLPVFQPRLSFFLLEGISE